VRADVPHQRRFGRRVERLHASRSYGFVLGLVLGELVFLAIGPNARWAWSVFVLLQAFILLIAVWTSGLAVVARRPAIASS
jgi:uncharacterized membrane protein YgaE (UPF0421/DUF939 family)